MDPGPSVSARVADILLSTSSATFYDPDGRLVTHCPVRLMASRSRREGGGNSAPGRPARQVTIAGTMSATPRGIAALTARAPLIPHATFWRWFRALRLFAGARTPVIHRGARINRRNVTTGTEGKSWGNEKPGDAPAARADGPPTREIGPGGLQIGPGGLQIGHMGRGHGVTIQVTE